MKKTLKSLSAKGKRSIRRCMYCATCQLRFGAFCAHVVVWALGTPEAANARVSYARTGKVRWESGEAVFWPCLVESVRGFLREAAIQIKSAVRSLSAMLILRLTPGLTGSMVFYHPS